MKKTILIVEDSPEFRKRYTLWANEFGYNVVSSPSVKEAMEKLKGIEAVITDYSLGEENGNDLAKKIRKKMNIPIAGITSGAPSAFDNRVIDISESKNI